MKRMPALVSSLFLVACGGASTMMSNDPPPPDNGLQIKSGQYTVGAGEEKYYCVAMDVPGTVDQAITSYTFFNSSIVHHAAIFTPASPEPTGLYECAPTIKLDWFPIGAGGRNTKGITVPDGAGFPIKAGSQILVQYHLLNASTSSVTEQSFVNLTYAADASKVIPAGIFAFGSMNIDIPAGAMGKTITSGCTVQKHMDVFGVFPHMHKLGTAIELDKGTSATDMQQVYQRKPWNFGDQPCDTSTMTVNPGDYMSTTCTYDNTTTSDVMYGESTSNEMCYLILFYTPFDHLDGCIN